VDIAMREDTTIAASTIAATEEAAPTGKMTIKAAKDTIAMTGTDEAQVAAAGLTAGTTIAAIAVADHLTAAMAEVTATEDTSDEAMEETMAAAEVAMDDLGVAEIAGARAVTAAVVAAIAHTTTVVMARVVREISTMAVVAAQARMATAVAAEEDMTAVGEECAAAVADIVAMSTMPTPVPNDLPLLLLEAESPRIRPFSSLACYGNRP